MKLGTTLLKPKNNKKKTECKTGSGTKENQDRPISQEGYCLYVLGCDRDDIVLGLPGKEKDHNWRILCSPELAPTD